MSTPHPESPAPLPREKRPYLRSYWARPGKLIAGAYPGDRDPALATEKLTALLRCGVSSIFSLMEPSECNHGGQPFVPYELEFQQLARNKDRNVTFFRFPIRDGDTPSVAYMRQILDHLDAEMAHDRIVYVHCWGGRGRTPTVVACHLIRHGVFTAKTVIDHLKELTAHAPQHFSPVPEVPKQATFITNWKFGQ